MTESAATSSARDFVEAPLVSVIVLNYNGAAWLPKCLESVAKQTMFERLEVIVADNNSPDKSDKLAAELMRDWSNGRVIQNGANLGFCEGNNRAARAARGDWLFFLNNDTWLEPGCLEALVREAESSGASAAGPLVMDYDSEAFQSLGAAGFDVFGLASTRQPHGDKREVFMPEGCAYLIRRTTFLELGGFDSEFFMFSDEFDLTWRLWLTGHRAVAVPAARMHHRGAAQVNPAGGESVVEFRTSDTKRFYANRNGMLSVLKNAGGLLWILAPFQVLLLALEMMVGLMLVWRWSFVREAYVKAGRDCWRLRGHVIASRERLRPLRARSDWWLARRFLRLRLNRWDEIQRMRKLGRPRVSS